MSRKFTLIASLAAVCLVSVATGWAQEAKPLDTEGKLRLLLAKAEPSAAEATVDRQLMLDKIQELIDRLEAERRGGKMVAPVEAVQSVPVVSGTPLPAIQEAAKLPVPATEAAHRSGQEPASNSVVPLSPKPTANSPDRHGGAELSLEEKVQRLEQELASVHQRLLWLYQKLAGQVGDPR
jgi:hypothetical protein